MSKPFIVIYLGLGNINPSDIRMKIEEMTEKLDRDKADYYVVPTSNKNTKIECINPQYITKQEYAKKITDILSYTQEVSDNFIKEHHIKLRNLESEYLICQEKLERFKNKLSKKKFSFKSLFCGRKK